MEAWRQRPLGRENNDVSPSKKRIDLTPTGLLMEGHYTHRPGSAKFLNECNRLVTTAQLGRSPTSRLPMTRRANRTNSVALWLSLSGRRLTACPCSWRSAAELDRTGQRWYPPPRARRGSYSSRQRLGSSSRSYRRQRRKTPTFPENASRPSGGPQSP